MSLFNEKELRSGPIRMGRSKTASAALTENAVQFSEDDTYDIFLSHAFLDADLILRVKQRLEAFNFSVYVDWIVDKHLDRTKVTKANARRLRERMDRCRSLVYARTLNSDTSIWMPWELGYFDGMNGRAAILPIAKDRTETDEYSPKLAYLGLYPYLSKTADTMGRSRIWVNETLKKYVRLDYWIAGQDPYLRT